MHNMAASQTFMFRASASKVGFLEAPRSLCGARRTANPACVDLAGDHLAVPRWPRIKAKILIPLGRGLNLAERDSAAGSS